MIALEEEQETITYKLHPGQAKAWKSKARFVMCVSGVQSGKTWFGPIWLTREISRYPGKKWIVLSPTVQMLRDIVIPEWENFVKGTDFEGKLQRFQTKYSLPDGGTIYFRSAEKPDKVEGIQAQGVWADEADNMKEGIWPVITARLSIARGRCLFTTTPYPKGFMRHSLVKSATAGNPDYDLITWESRMNPMFSEEEFQDAKKKWPPALFEMRYCGKFTDLVGLVYKDFRQCIIPDRVVEGEDYQGMDFGFKDPTAVLYTKLDAKGILHVYKEYLAAEKTTEVHATLMDKKLRYHCDPQNSAIIAEFRKCGCMMIPSDNNFLTGVNYVTERMRTGRLYIHKRGAKQLIKELETYAYGDNNFPKRDQQDHLIHCLEYICKGLVADGWLIQGSAA